MPDLRLLTFSTLYPSAAMPRHGLFVEKRLQELIARHDVESRVVAPVPWFPVTHRAFGSYAAFARVSRAEQRRGLTVLHPRFLRMPKIGMSTVPYAMYRAALPQLRRLLADGYDFDLIDAHYFYPDGVAAVMLARALEKPVIITARGTDLNLIPQYRRPRRQIQWAAAHADAMITVCAALRESLVELGVDSSRVSVLRNGVDLGFFRPAGRQAARDELGLPQDASIVLSVGLLIDRKGHDIPIRALPALDGVHLLIAGDGERRAALETLAEREGVSGRVSFLGSVAHERLRLYFSAADALVLASSREGWANVLLESMACDTPVIASNVWGTPEVVAHPDAGVLMPERTPDGFVEAFRTLFAHYPAAGTTRRYAEGFSWDDTSDGQFDLMRRVVAQRASQP